MRAATEAVLRPKIIEFVFEIQQYQYAEKAELAGQWRSN